ncbi:MAG: hypothetical protein ABI763_04350 [Bacteroidota bacterium]
MKIKTLFLSVIPACFYSNNSAQGSAVKIAPTINTEKMVPDRILNIHKISPGHTTGKSDNMPIIVPDISGDQIQNKIESKENMPVKYYPDRTPKLSSALSHYI